VFSVHKKVMNRVLLIRMFSVFVVTAQIENKLKPSGGKMEQQKKNFLEDLGHNLDSLGSTISSLNTAIANHNHSLVAYAEPARKPELIHYLTGEFRSKPYRGEWISDCELLTSDFRIENIKTGKSIEIIKDVAERESVSDILLSADRKFALGLVFKRKVWRSSFLGMYVLFSLKTKNDIKGFPAQRTYIRFVLWAPTGNSIAYVDKNNNIFFRKSATSKSLQITTQGILGTVYCGIPDWLYEEEVFESSQAMWWSPDSRKLAYAVFDDRNVSEYSWNHYGSWKTVVEGFSSNTYPNRQNIRYPKAGTKNPKVELWIVDLSDGWVGKKFHLKPPKTLEEPLLTSVVWASNKTIVVNWMNRVQNESVMMAFQIADGSINRSNIAEQKEPNGWVEIGTMQITPFKTVHNKNKDAWIYLSPDKSKERYYQIFLDGGKSKQLTRNAGDVTKIVKVTDNGDIYFIGVNNEDRKTRHLFKQAHNRARTVSCLSCKIKNHVCEFVEASISFGGTYTILTCLGPGVPYSLLLHTHSQRIIKTLEYNGHLRKLKPRSHSVFKSIGKSNVELILPTGVGLESKEKRPTVLYVYGGPGSQEVHKKWEESTIIISYLVETKGFIGVKIDVRGSGNNGAAYKMANYRNLGTHEVDATIKIMHLLQKSYDVIDPKRIGIYGWSFGGYFTLSALTRDHNEVFSCGVSVAPVALWELYDSAYTERFMSTPIDNPEGYNRSTPLWNVNNLRSKKYMLMHGTEDDNVHYQQSMFIAQELERQNILFKQITYPDQNHSIGDYIQHLFHSIYDFFDDCFQ